MKTLSFLKNTGYIVVLGVLVTLAGLLVAGKFGIGGVRALVVQSGSMEPLMPLHSIVLTAPAPQYHPDDIITYRQSGRDQVLVTHRVIRKDQSSEGVLFVTKGDANEEEDAEKVLYQDIVGKVRFTIPFIGRVVAFVQTQIGFILLIIVPATAIVISELSQIRSEVRKIITAKKEANL